MKKMRNTCVLMMGLVFGLGVGNATTTCHCSCNFPGVGGWGHTLTTDSNDCAAACSAWAASNGRSWTNADCTT